VTRIEGFRVQNYRSLRDVTLGDVSFGPATKGLTPLTAVIGKNGTGKSTLFDAFGFLADCLATGVEAACDREWRGGFERLRSLGVQEPIRLRVSYREGSDQPRLVYDLAIDLDESGRPFVGAEYFGQSDGPLGHDNPVPLLNMKNGVGLVVDAHLHRKGLFKAIEEGSRVNLADSRQLAIATLGALKDHPRIARFREFLKGWYLSYFDAGAARGLPVAGPQRHLNARGDNIGNVVQFMQREYKDRFKSILRRIAERIPGISSIDTHITEDKRVLLRFNDGGFQDPFFAQQISDGTLKAFAYLLLLEDPDPPPFICIEEPENGLHHKLLETLAREFRAHATGRTHASQIFVTTHQPYFVDALSPEEVWILEKGSDGFSTVRRVSDLEIAKDLVAEGLPLGGLWYSDYLDSR
jgi:predicted ATPase